MRILIIRHGDPDYTIDSLTEKGWREAHLLADMLENEKIDDVYCSTMGRARDTASETLKRKGLKAEYCDWLREIDNMRTIDPEKPDCDRAMWDFMPSFFGERELMHQKDNWMNDPIIKSTNIPELYKNVCDNLDKVLSRHGYDRNGNIYTTKKGNHDTVAFFCHFGCESVLLSHLLNVSPFIFLQNFCALPTAVTTIYTEERKQGIASLRCTEFGSTAHLYKGGEQPSFAARFCECFEDDTRH